MIKPVDKCRCLQKEKNIVDRKKQSPDLKIAKFLIFTLARKVMFPEKAGHREKIFQITTNILVVNGALSHLTGNINIDCVSFHYFHHE